MYKQVLLFPIGAIKSIFSRQFYYIIPEPIFFLAIILLWWKTGLFVIKYHPMIWVFYIIYIIGFFVYCFDVFQQRRKRRSEDRKFGGYLRWDGVFEVHIGDVLSEREFYRKLMMAIVYCRDRQLPMEFITANRTYGRVIRDFGDAILRIKQLGWYSRMILASLESKSIVNLSPYPILIRIDPRKLKIKQLKNGNMVII